MNCPLCGEPAILDRWDNGVDPDTGYHDIGELVICEHCGELTDADIQLILDAPCVPLLDTEEEVLTCQI